MDKVKVNEVTLNEFLSLVDKGNQKVCENCTKELYVSWGNISKEMDQALDVIGIFQNSDYYIEKNGYTEFHPEGTNYWSENAPIAIAYYPYHESKIRVCKKCSTVFLNYTDYAGHAPQNRIRQVRKDIIALDGFHG